MGLGRCTRHEKVTATWLSPFSFLDASLSAFTLQAVQQIERSAPFGQSNSRPLLFAAGVLRSGTARPLRANGHHLAMTLCQDGRRLWRRRLGRRASGGRWAARRSLPSHYQSFPRPAERGTAPGRLAAGFPVGERPPSRAAVIGLCPQKYRIRWLVVVKSGCLCEHWDCCPHVGDRRFPSSCQHSLD